MKFISQDVLLQPLAVVTNNDARSGLDAEQSIEPSTGSAPGSQNSPTASVLEKMIVTEVWNNTFYDTPVIWESELGVQYRDVGEALGSMVRLEAGDELKIEPSVYTMASFIATGLYQYGAPAPRVFTHGPKSVVFNWSAGLNNLYLTISADKFSVLVTTPQQIEKRVDLSLKAGFDPVRLMESIPRQFVEQKVLVLPSGKPILTEPLR